MRNSSWILLDTETTGLAVPIFMVELSAQRMRGWVPEGEVRLPVGAPLGLARKESLRRRRNLQR